MSDLRSQKLFSQFRCVTVCFGRDDEWVLSSLEGLTIDKLL